MAMKFLQSLWIPDIRQEVVWAGSAQDPDYWTLSNRLLNKYGDVEFWGCSNGIDFAERAGLRFSKIHNLPDEFSALGSKCWSLPKIYAAAQQSEPFLHVDGDVFLYDWSVSELPEFLVQNGEPYHADKAQAWFYGLMATLFRARAPGVERFWGHPVTIWNFGIFGGRSALLPSICGEIFDFAVENCVEINKVPIDVFTACVLEQIFIPMLMCNSGVFPTEYLRSEHLQDDAAAKGFCHLIGHTKNLPWVKDSVRERLRALEC